MKIARNSAHHVIGRESIVVMTIAVSFYASVVAAFTLSSPPEPEPPAVTLSLSLKVMEQTPVKEAVTPATPLQKKVAPASKIEPLPPKAVAEARPAKPNVEKAPEPVVPEVIDAAVEEVIAASEPEPAPTPDETPLTEVDTNDALTADQAEALPFMMASIDDEYFPPLSHSNYLHNPKPHYPRAARKRGIEGRVMVSVLVDRDGLPLETTIHTSSGYGVLDRAALKAVRGWRFEAARRGNVRVEGEVLVPINFQLTQG